jgi:hypothetical protein
LSGTITVVVVPRNSWLIDGKLLKVGASVTVELGVSVREKTTLEQRVISEVDATHYMAYLELLLGQKVALKDKRRYNNIP